MNTVIRADLLYHYTSHGVLKSIVENASLWVSNAYYMNDSNEIKHAADLFKRFISERIEIELDNEIEGFLNELKEWTNHLIRNPHYIFIFSLTENGNLLSQWRAYTPHGTGISIGLNKDKLEKLANNSGFQLFKCIYEFEEKKSILNKEIEQIITKFISDKDDLDVSNKPKNQKYTSYLSAFAGDLLKIFCRIKDSTFEEEREWRLISKYYESYTDPVIQFREGKTTLIPYIQFKIAGIREDGYLFDQVYVGPSPNFEISMPAITAFLSNHRACKVTINSLSPYREI